jgi:ABC-type nitrate/sulfonate/bicarbonate transport system substrate-binding protein
MIDSAEIVKQLCAVGAKILVCCKDESIIQSVKLKMLDGAFVAENYDLAVEMLEKGIPGKDQEWHALTIPKVKAHRALAKNKPLEAIDHFRQFMTEWKNAKKTEEFDPSTGIAYSREWILGRNALRIAKIYATIPDAEKQKETLVEANEYFKVALTKVEKNSEELKALTKEIKEAGL